MPAQPNRGQAAHVLLPAATGLGGLAIGLLAAQFSGPPPGAETGDGEVAVADREPGVAAMAAEEQVGSALAPNTAPAVAALDQLSNSGPSDANASQREAVLPGAGALSGLAEQDPELYAELQAFLRSGNLEALLADNPMGARQFLLSLYLQTGNPLDALDLVERSPELPSGSWIQVADALQGTHPDRAAYAVEQAIRAQTEHGFTWEWPYPDWINRLAGMDPERALQVLEDNRASLEPLPKDVQQLWARALTDSGRMGEARNTLMELLEDPDQASQALRQLAKLDAEAAEAELRSRMGQPGQPDDVRQQLMSLLLEQGRSDEAVELLETAMAEGSGDMAALLNSALGSLPENVVDEHLSDWMERANSNDQGLWGSVARHYIERGDLASATEHFLEGWERSANANGNWLTAIPSELQEHDPGRVLATLDRLQENAGSRDELWGDIADHYWRLGQFEAARNAWAQASEHDPGDGEWTGKLSKYDKGINPVGGSNTPSGWQDGQGQGSTEKPPQSNPFFNANPFGGGNASQGAYFSGGFSSTNFGSQVFFNGDLSSASVLLETIPQEVEDLGY